MEIWTERELLWRRDIEVKYGSEWGVGVQQLWLLLMALVFGNS